MKAAAGQSRLARRISGWTAALALAITLGALLLVEALFLRAQYRDTLYVEAAMVAENSAAALLFSDPVTARLLLAAIAQDSEVEHAGLYDASGRLFASFLRTLPDGGAPQPPPAVVDTLTMGENVGLDSIRVRVPVRHQGRVIGAVEVRGGLESLRAHLLAFGVTLLAVGAAGLALAWLLLARLRREVESAEERMAWRAHHDALTGLPNRHLFQDRLQQALGRAHRAQRLLALLYVDLDNFKTVNDTHGHEAGDHLLQAVAARLAARLRASDTLARLSGDEFGVLMEGLPDASDAAQLAAGLIEALSAPFVAAGQPAFVGASVGIALFPQDARNSDELLRCADAAMYHAKESGRGNVQFFTADLNQHLQRRLVYQAGLRLALARGELELHYQPVEALADGRIEACEALLRWRHPDHGLLRAEDFIHAAGETGFAHLLGEWVLRTTAAQAAAWRAGPAPGLRVAANITAAQLMRADFIEQLTAILRDTGAPGEALELEITEDTLLQPGADTATRLAAVRGLGVTLTVDDFGVGYSSLTYLKRQPISTLKIDRAFVRDTPQDPEATAIVRAIIALGRSLGLRVVAEGVETAAQRALLAALGCDAAQGYLLAAPMPASELTPWLAARSSGVEGCACQ
jgi:diguanylate cyclase (GGDEF)-like protein